MSNSQTNPNPPSSDDSLETIIARVNFYESSVEQLKKELPKYLHQIADTEKSHTAMSKVLRSVASAEPNNVLQYITFLYAQKEEILGKEQVRYQERVTEVKEMLDNWSKLLILPMRDVIADHSMQNKKSSKAPAPQPATQPPAPAPSSARNPQNSSQLPNTATPTSQDPSGNPISAPASDTAAEPPAELPAELPALPGKALLPVHMKLFEKHRLKEMKKLLHTMLLNEVQYHAKALEAYSCLLECITDAEERDQQLPI